MSDLQLKSLSNPKTSSSLSAEETSHIVGGGIPSSYQEILDYFDDMFNGGTGNDIIYGGPGNDIAFGGTGNDIIDGGAGNDVLIGD